MNRSVFTCLRTWPRCATRFTGLSYRDFVEQKSYWFCMVYYSGPGKKYVWEMQAGRVIFGTPWLFFHEHNYGLFTFHRFPADFHHHSPGMSFEEFEFLSELKTKFETFLTKFTHRKSFICPVGVPRSFLAARHGIFWMKLNMLGNSIARD